MLFYASPLHTYVTSVITMLALIWGATGENPLLALVRALRQIITNHRFLTGFLIILLMLAVNAYETAWENAHGQVVSWDLTEPIARMGGMLVVWIQQLAHPVLTHLFTFIYVILLPVFGFASIIIYARRQDWTSFRRLVVGLSINYVVALPFYLLMPVREAWSYWPQIQSLIPQVFPTFEVDYRPMSGITHCFPSLHTSLALTCALVAVRSGDRRLARVMGTGAGLVIFSTLYLGIHWPLDLAAGTILAAAATGFLPGLARPRAWLRNLTGQQQPLSGD